MTWYTVGAAAISVVGGYLNNKNAQTQRSSSGTSGFCSCVQAGTRQAIQTAEGIANQPFQGFCVCNAVAGLSPAQKAAQESAMAETGCLPGLRATADQGFNAQTLSQYENPYISQVLDAQNALASRNYQTEMAGLQSREGMTSAFGGDRSAIAENQLTTGFNLQSDVRNKEGLSNAYNAGVSAFNQDRQFAAGRVGQIESALSTTGGVCQATRQNRANFNYNQFCQQRNWQKQQNAYLSQTLAQVPKGQYYSGNQTATTIPAGGGWGGALAGASSILGKGGFGGNVLPANTGACGIQRTGGFCSACTPAEVQQTMPSTAGGAFVGGGCVPNVCLA